MLIKFISGFRKIISLRPQHHLGLTTPARNMPPLPVIVSSNFDGGNGDVSKIRQAKDGSVDVELTIRQEPFTEGTDKRHHKQW